MQRRRPPDSVAAESFKLVPGRPVQEAIVASCLRGKELDDKEISVGR
jgi:hypothetical protein